MRIAVLAPIAWRTPPKQYGPWEQMASNLTEGLVNLGVDVTLFATHNSLTAANLESVVEQGYAENPDVDAKVAECLHISNLMEQASRFDLIHNHFDFLPLTWSRLIKTPVITTIHGFSSAKIVPVFKKYNGDTHYVSISNADRHPELNYLATVYNGINISDFTFNRLPDDFLLFFGRIHPDKGTAEAIQIARKAGRKLVISGLVQDERYFNEKVEPFLAEDILFIGQSGPEKRNQLLGKASALLHPISFAEPFGLSVAEAMMCGTPVIAFNKGSMPELIRHEETGFLVTDIDEAAEAVNNLNLIKRENCRQWAAAQFSRDRMVNDYLECYRKII